MFILVNDVHDLVVLSTDGTSEIYFKNSLDIFKGTGPSTGMGRDRFSHEQRGATS
jgi:hypothetical protein